MRKVLSSITVVFLSSFAEQWNLTTLVYMTSNECQNVADAVKEVFSACGVEISAEYPTGDLTDNSSVMVDWLTDIKTKARSKRIRCSQIVSLNIQGKFLPK